jgi:hypothetical protein
VTASRKPATEIALPDTFRAEGVMVRPSYRNLDEDSIEILTLVRDQAGAETFRGISRIDARRATQGFARP